MTVQPPIAPPAGVPDPWAGVPADHGQSKILPNPPNASHPSGHPEWVGSVPSKWTDRASGNLCSRNIVYTAARSGDKDSLARMSFGGYFSDVRGLERQTGRKYIQEKQYPEGEWKPLVKKVDEVSGWDRPARPEGTKRPQVMENQRPTMRREKRHIRQVESHQESYDVPEGKQIVQHNFTSADGSELQMRRADKIAAEQTLEQMMSRKQGKPKTLLEQRNGVGVASLGDKYYKYPEYSDRFFRGIDSCGYARIGRTAELIPGSGFVRGSYQKTIPRMTTNWQAFAAECYPDSCRRKTFAQLEAEAAQAEAENSVTQLTKTWEKKELKFGDPNYEEPSDSDDEQGGGE
ncbi:unnamed protein product [Amoebophrya sp. A25]|nr:unnamed protein product [Amoebophrya sp. A25]|eukprot:GSA25T00013976001.1